MGGIGPVSIVALTVVQAAQPIGLVSHLQPREVGGRRQAIQGADLGAEQRRPRVVPHHDRPRDRDPLAPGARLTEREAHGEPSLGLG